MGMIMMKNDKHSPTLFGSSDSNSPTNNHKLEFEDLSIITKRTIKGGLNYTEETRQDMQGNTILKRKEAPVDKKNRPRCPQKITFKDTVEDLDRDKQALSEVIYVESYKKYN